MDIKVQYSTMIVNDMEESVAFYRDNLGFSIDSRYELGPGARITLMQGKGCAMLELIENKEYEIGLYSVGMDVDNLTATLQQLAAKGIAPSLGPLKTTVGSMAFISDPNGVRLCLIEHDK